MPVQIVWSWKKLCVKVTKLECRYHSNRISKQTTRESRVQSSDQEDHWHWVLSRFALSSEDNCLIQLHRRSEKERKCILYESCNCKNIYFEWKWKRYSLHSIVCWSGDGKREKFGKHKCVFWKSHSIKLPRPSLYNCFWRYWQTDIPKESLICFNLLFQLFFKNNYIFNSSRFWMAIERVWIYRSFTLSTKLLKVVTICEISGWSLYSSGMKSWCTKSWDFNTKHLG